MEILRPESIPALADVIEEYLRDDLEAHCGLFEVYPRTDVMHQINVTDLVRTLAFEPEDGNNRRLLDSLLDRTKTRCADRISRTVDESRDYHTIMMERIRAVERELAGSAAPSELAVPPARRFIAQSELRNLLSTAEAEVTLVDNYIGPATLDCLLNVDQNIRLLTGARVQSISDGFDRSLAAFVSEGRTIEIRRHNDLHDRHIAFGGRCWLLGSSIKDAGKKSFNMVEIVGLRDAVVADIDTKWVEATKYEL